MVAAAPGETLECIDIYHVGQNGYAYGPPNFDRFSDGNVAGLLDAWLDWPARRGILWSEPVYVSFNVPVINGVEVTKERQKFLPRTLPFVATQDGGVVLRTPPGKVAPVFPEAEFAQHVGQEIGPLRLEIDAGGIALFVAPDAGNRAWPAGILEAAPPLHGFYPTGIGLDDLHHWVRMRSVVEQARSEPVAALQRARAVASPYLDTGRTTRTWSWLMPQFYETNDWKTVIQRGAMLGLNDVRKWEELKDSEAWRKAMTEWIDIRRAWGPIGFFWALLIDRLESAQTARACERCGRPITGTQRRRFCSLEENGDCFRARRAADRRGERQRER